MVPSRFLFKIRRLKKKKKGFNEVLLYKLFLVSINYNNVKATTLSAKKLGLKLLIMTFNQMKWEIKVDPK
jgi:hypothetical protein